MLPFHMLSRIEQILWACLLVFVGGGGPLLIMYLLH